MPTGTAPTQYVGGSDRTTPLPSRTAYSHDPYATKKPLYDWGTADPAVWDAANGRTPKAPAAKKAKAIRKPRTKRTHRCTCGGPKARVSQQCATCYNTARRDNAAPTPTCTACGTTITTASTTGHCRRCAALRRRSNSAVDLDTIRTEYLAGDTIPTIAARHDWPIASIRTKLRRAGVTMRDDRHARSGGRRTEDDDPGLIEKVRHLYYDQGHSQPEVARRLGLGVKSVQNLMRRNGMAGRERQAGTGDTLGPVRERLAAIGVTSRDIRDWAHANGVPVTKRGVVSFAVIDAYEEAHQ